MTPFKPVQLSVTFHFHAFRKPVKNNRRVWYGKKRSNEDELKMRVSQRGKSLFGFTGAQLHKTMNFEKRCWQGTIMVNRHLKSLGYHLDPLSCEILHDVVQDALHN